VTPRAKFCVNLTKGGLLGKYVKYNYAKAFFTDLYIPFFRNSPTGQTPLRIFARNGSNDVVLRTDVPFKG